MKHLFLVTATFLLAACAVSWSQLGGDLLNDFEQGAVSAQDAFTAYNALNQSLTTANVTTGKLDPAKVLAAAEAGATALNTPGLATAVNALVADANKTIADLSSKGATAQAIISTVSAQGATAIQAVAATSPAK